MLIGLEMAFFCLAAGLLSINKVISELLEAYFV